MKEFKTGDLVLVSLDGKKWKDQPMCFLYRRVDGASACQEEESYLGSRCWKIAVYDYIKPVPKTETRVLKQQQMMEELTKRGYTPTRMGVFTARICSNSFRPEMWFCCGRKPDSVWVWEPWMLEDVEVSE
jgi:hypothetical protein